MAARQSARQLARQISSQCSRHQTPTRRAFSSTPTSLAASNFTMPAMSPTMTEGNISSWKVKEGDSFSAGDILLEIETDKATMDVEAQDDGVVAKIFSADGSKAVKVGTRIAVLAEPGDDVSSLEIPADDSQPAGSSPENARADGKEGSTASSGVQKEATGTPETKRPAKDTPQTSPTGPGQNPKYPLYPSVIALIHEHHLPDSEVMKITATGPNGRLLKGDVLAHLGAIDAGYSAEQSKRIEHNSHLDLSNIKILPPAPKPAKSDAASLPDPELPVLSTITLPISLTEVLKVQKRIKDTLGVSLSLSTFLARAVDVANDDLPLPKGAKPSSEDLFNAVLGLNNVPTTSRGTYLPQIDAFPAPFSRASLQKASKSSKVDIIDILSGRSTPKRSLPPRAPIPSITTADGALNLFSLTVPSGEEKRARTFLERVKTVLQVEPGKLVL